MSNAVVTIVVTTTPVPVNNAAYSNTVITLTDANSVTQTANVNGTESPAWVASFSNVATGNGTVIAQAFDVNGLTLGTAISATFTEVGTPPVLTFPAPTGLTVAVS